jgi:peptidoglycan/xylan/chitin deacetylase (PgdA/CDA1 family)
MAAGRTVPHFLRGMRQLAFRVADQLELCARVGQSEWRRRRLLILGYHGVSLDDEHEWNPRLYVRQETLHARCDLLRRHGYTVLPLGEAVRRLYDDTLPRAAVALTFDDGNHDFAVRAVPVLAEFGFPSTSYVTTFYSRVQRPVFDPVAAYVAWKGRARGECSGEGLVPDGGALRVASSAERARTALRLRAACRERRLDAEAKDDVAREFAGRLGVDYDDILEKRLFRVMTPQEVAGLHAHGVDVQLHTHRHRSPDDHALFLREIRDNRRELRAMIGADVPLTHFCYPNGTALHGFVPWLREVGVTTATTCHPALATPADDPLLLPRYVDAESLSLSTFSAWVSGAATLLTPRARAVALNPAMALVAQVAADL